MIIIMIIISYVSFHVPCLYSTGGSDMLELRKTLGKKRLQSYNLQIRSEQKIKEAKL